MKTVRFQLSPEQRADQIERKLDRTSRNGGRVRRLLLMIPTTANYFFPMVSGAH